MKRSRRFMKPLALGLDISDYSIEMVALLDKRGAAVVSRALRTELPAGLVRRGVIQDPVRLAAELSRLLDEAFGPKRPKMAVALALPEDQVFSKTFSLPASLTPAQAAQAAAIGAADIFPAAVDDAVSNVSVRPSAQAGQQSVFYVAVEKAVAASYVELLRRVGLRPLLFDSEAASIARSLVGPEETEPALIADIGAKTTLLAVVEGGRAVFSSSVSVAGDALTSAIEVKLNLPLAQAEKLKRKAGFDPGAESGRVFLILQKPMGEIIDEVGRTLRYYERTSGRTVRKIILAGGTSLIPGVVDYVASNFNGVTVARGEPLKTLVIDADAKADDLKKHPILYATAAGLALRAVGLRPAPGLDLLPEGAGIGPGATDVVRRVFDAASEIVTMMSKPIKLDLWKRGEAPAGPPAKPPFDEPVRPVATAPPGPEEAAAGEAAAGPAGRAKNAGPKRGFLESIMKIRKKYGDQSKKNSSQEEDPGPGRAGGNAGRSAGRGAGSAVIRRPRRTGSGRSGRRQRA